MIYFDTDMSKNTNTVVYFDWKTVIYIYVCGTYRTQFMLPMEKSVTFTGACVNEIIPSINRSFIYKEKEGRYVRITDNVIQKPYQQLWLPFFIKKKQRHICARAVQIVEQRTI